MQKITINKTKFTERVILPLCSITATLVLWFGLLTQEHRSLFFSAIMKMVWPF